MIQVEASDDSTFLVALSLYKENVKWGRWELAFVEVLIYKKL